MNTLRHRYLISGIGIALTGLLILLVFIGVGSLIAMYAMFYLISVGLA